MVALLGAVTDKWVWKLFCGRNLKISNSQVKFAAKNQKSNVIASELLVKVKVKRVVSFGAVLYHNQ